MSLTWVIEAHKEVQSTQDIVKGMADMGLPEGQVVQAALQTSGRGRHGRRWESLEGNLFLSILFRPSCKAQEIGQLSLLTGLALIETIGSFVDADKAELSLKWPNDVLLNGEKCAGILLETELTSGGAVSSAVVGLGVNIEAAPRGLGLALKEFAIAPIDLNSFRDVFLKSLGAYYHDWLVNGFDDIRMKWLKHAHPQGSALSVKIGPQLENGIFHDIDAQGNLRLRDAEHRLKVITAGEVYLY